MTADKNQLDFLVIGAQKAGTTTLFEYLRRHPEIFLPTRKEAAYFSHDRAVAEGWDAYLRENFGGVDETRKWGTASPSYMVGGVFDRGPASDEEARHPERTIPLRIRRQLPSVRLVALLRDPIERARSHHRMMVLRGEESRGFDQAIDSLLTSEALAEARAHPRETTGYVVWGEYGRILDGYVEVFGEERLLVGFTDELETSPADLLAAVHEFLGVDREFLPDNLGKKYRQGASRRRLSRLEPDAVVHAIARGSLPRRIWHSLPRDRRLALSRAYAGARYRVELWNRRDGSEEERPAEATLERLREHFAPDAERLAALLGRPPRWAGKDSG